MTTEEADALAGLKRELPNLSSLTDKELSSAIERGGLLSALIRYRIKEELRPRGRGRPKKPPKIKPLRQTRGRKSEKPLLLGRANIHIAEYAHAYKTCLKCSAVKAAEATLMELKGNFTPTERRQLAKLITEIRPRAYDKMIRSKPRVMKNLPENSLAGILKYSANKS